MSGTLTQKPVVLLQHGMGGDATEFFFNAPFKAPAFSLSQAGFDLWFGNNRGTLQSMGHTHLDPFWNRAEYWEYDFDELGIYDVPAEIDFILEVTGQEKLSFIGHSMGTTQMLTGLSDIPEYY